MVIDSDLIEEVLAVERDWVAAHLSMDMDVLSSIVGENYRQIQSDGSVIGRDELLDSYHSGNRRWQTALGDNYEVRVIGEVARKVGVQKTGDQLLPRGGRY